MSVFDEMGGLGGGGGVRACYQPLARWLAEAPAELLEARSRQAELYFRRMGITFSVYGAADSNERLIPFDVVPRIVSAPEWLALEAGLVQRVAAINLFLKDIYGRQECIRGWNSAGRYRADQPSFPPGNGGAPATARRVGAYCRR